MIDSFGSVELSRFFDDDLLPRGARWISVRKVVRRKLAAIHAASDVNDLKAPPGNRLERLRGDLAGYFSIRVNDQWRVIFRWKQGAAGASDVAVVDYH